MKRYDNAAILLVSYYLFFASLQHENLPLLQAIVFANGFVNQVVEMVAIACPLRAVLLRQDTHNQTALTILRLV